MRNNICFLIIICLFSNLAFGDCNWSKDITPLKDGNYEYTKDCHLEVGKLVEDSGNKDQQIKDLSEAIQLKNLALTQSDQRAQLWNDASKSLEDRLQKVDQEEKHNNLLWLTTGILGTVLVGFMTARLIGR